VTAIWLFLKGVPVWVWVAIALLGAGLLYGSSRYDAGLDKGRAELAAHLEADKVATAKFNAETAKKDAAQAEALRQVGFQYERDKAHALDQKDAVIASLRSGALVLRKQWRCPKAPVSDAPSGAGSGNEEAELRFADIGNLVRIGHEADAQVRACQAVIDAERQ
jgi:hypothetical protein